MFSLNEDNRYYLYSDPTDMRKGFDRLQGIIQDQMNRNAQDGSVYVFMNKNRNLIKLLHWEKGGFTLYYKRLEKGLFERPVNKQMQDQDSVDITWSELMLIVEGIELSSVRKKKRYALKKGTF